MIKKISFLAGIIITIAIFFILLLKITKKDSLKYPVKEEKKATQTKIEKLSDDLKEYLDQAGFKFKYPDNFSVAIMETGEEIFSSLVVASDELKGKTTIVVESTTAKSLDELLGQKKIVSDKLQKISLADIEARQYEKDNSLITVAYDTGAFFTITTELIPARETMLKLHKTIITSFAFQLPEETSVETNSQSTGENDVIFEGEEVIE
ncbi:hypothetical protein A3C98_02585 [Candidatus Roizmanbacteria bacterium RIFCSPHIGHO2_02_FULL_37_15]|uniref:Uncharacterized protein n=1 Tax=Candidatus Roizmanbacteria bacterium RIFCSPLOWO2_01_FULL_37_16 TaxID=1802058 RepID=A0A1F7IN85_9BACT|nr:MAG: hypothetical protein A2859_03110 [Candidatus Roizmanbacteria bacterium RIFCSPHIGHO2_01_FULL_37_16b]OGK20784.1 MAG: hypothetical protein A3C98_02585 [Candidatus Roizmanbacteria bacterium RIFCSPHIGHO2_02_FULL_37_15]OGK32968.1 MAG: hypothetical protein A3F57_03285 [Candidatus Roizmanbacteria bacterium RIFCSPHIGHO2_12_FULL_36_11]OGK44854.1 MAG: hypothetical protein A3B40_03590 [Candidatus Roizmanbacteria bacterium RIFCSPLOWO2_01_FULL_37_16]OGK57792.1 MAG: hypothetical protein A3I50_04480 [C